MKIKRLSDFPIEELHNARMAVANDYRELEIAIREKDPYASHVPESYKDKVLAEGLKHADLVEKGECDSNFSVWQRLYQKLTGECVPLFSK